MAIQSAILPYTLYFTFDAGTSRGVLRKKTSWFIRLQTADGRIGWGEAAPLPGLSPDGDADIGKVLLTIVQNLKSVTVPDSVEGALALASSLVSIQYPSVKFAIETALLGLVHRDSARIIHPDPFLKGEGIPINGLIWMGDEAFMRNQFRKKLDESFSCFKMKIGAINFASELDLLGYMRKQTNSIIRVDANGAFTPDEACSKLDALAELKIHSIEQPIMSGQWKEMARICRDGSIPVALDEELIGINGERRGRLLEAIQPPFIILKPTLLGGIQETLSWVNLAESMDIGWWITSALESNIGLNAICQLTQALNYSGHQGLGTGSLYSNNITSPLYIDEGNIYYDAEKSWQYPDMI